jgi:hypothetical protein
MNKGIADKTTHVQRLTYGREQALLSSPGGQRNLPFEDLEKRNDADRAAVSESVACMFADEFRVLELRREAR